MKKISREAFLKTGSLAVIAAFNPPNLFGASFTETDSIDEAMLSRLVKANDTSVEQFLKTLSSTRQRQYYRNLSESFSMLTAAFSHPKSLYYGSDEVLNAMSSTIDKLRAFQYPDGTLDSEETENRLLILHLYWIHYIPQR
ncbi:MAG: hypothetical protein R3C61_11070 [Bacteroidia bacterium]